MSSPTVNHSNEACLASTTEMLHKVTDLDLSVGRLEAAFSDSSHSSVPASAVLVQEVRQTYDVMKGKLVVPLNRLEKIVSDSQPATETIYECIKPGCTFVTISRVNFEQHKCNPQIRQRNSLNEFKLVVNDDANGDGSLQVSTQSQPQPQSPSSSSPENANVQSGDHHEGTEAANQGDRSFNDGLSRHESTVNIPVPRIVNNPGPKGKGNDTVPVGGGRDCGDQGDPSDDGGPEMDNEMIVPLRIQVDDELYLDLDDQNRDDAGADVVHVAENDQDPLDGNAAAVFDQEEPVPDNDDDDDDDDDDEEQEVAQRPTRDPKKVERVKFQLVSPSKAKNYYPRYKRTKPEPKLVLNRSDPLFKVIMAALRQSEASHENPVPELSRVLSNGRFQQLTIGFRTRRTRRAV